MRAPREYEPPSRRPWSAAGLADLVGSAAAVVLLGWTLSIGLEWLGMAFDWWDPPGAAHSRALLRAELDWLGRDFPAVVDRAERGAALGYRWSGLAALARWLVVPPSGGVLDPLRVALLGFGEYVLAAAYITQLTGVRLTVVALALPAFAAAGLLGAIDGLVQRDLRRFGGGAESGFLYHHLKTLLRPLFAGPVLIYLVSPWALHPTLVFVPPALLFGYFVRHTLSRFKKYL